MPFLSKIVFEWLRAYLFRPPRGMSNGTVLTIADEEGYWSHSLDGVC